MLTLNYALHHPWFFTVVPFFWALQCGVQSYFAGWLRMAKRFGVAALSRKARPMRFATGFFTTYRGLPVSFRNCLHLDVDESGIRFSVFFLWRWFHPPFVLPWEAIEGMSRERYFMVPHTVIHVRGEKARIRVALKAGTALEEAYARHAKRKPM